MRAIVYAHPVKIDVNCLVCSSMLQSNHYMSVRMNEISMVSALNYHIDPKYRRYYHYQHFDFENYDFQNYDFQN